MYSRIQQVKLLTTVYLKIDVSVSAYNYGVPSFI
jgi:hypothetical protein